MKKILLHAYGNPGRRDDGLGDAFVTAMEEWLQQHRIASVSTTSSFQLNVEDAADIVQYDYVIFVDASKGEREPYFFCEVYPSPHTSFTSHSLSAESVLSLCMELYTHHPKVYQLQIKGYDWEVGEGLSAKAKENLRNAIEFVQKIVINFSNQE